MQPELRATAQEDSETSVAAAIAIQVRVGGIDRQVLARIRQSPCTDQEGQDDTGTDGNTWRPSRVRLGRQGVIVPDGTRATRSGRQAVVWRTVRPDEPSTAQDTALYGRSATERTTTAAETAELWRVVRDTRPTWLPQRRHQRIVSDAVAACPGDLAGALRNALAELRELGGR